MGGIHTDWFSHWEEGCVSSMFLQHCDLTYRLKDNRRRISFCHLTLHVDFFILSGNPTGELQQTCRQYRQKQQLCVGGQGSTITNTVKKVRFNSNIYRNSEDRLRWCNWD